MAARKLCVFFNNKLNLLSLFILCFFLFFSYLLEQMAINTLKGTLKAGG